MMRIADAAGMRRRRSERCRYRDACSGEREQQQKSGSQALHVVPQMRCQHRTADQRAQGVRIQRLLMPPEMRGKFSLA